MHIEHHGRAIVPTDSPVTAPARAGAASSLALLGVLYLASTIAAAGCGGEPDSDSDSNMAVRGAGKDSSADRTAENDAQDPTADPLAAFLGDWVFASGTRTSDCDGEDTETEPIEAGAEAYSITRGPQGNAVISLGNCDIDFDLESGAAVVQPNQACRGMVRGTDIVIKHAFVAWTLDPLAGSRLRSSLTRLSVAGNRTGEVTCLIREIGVLARAATR